jgi:hypothetical protein
MMAGELSPWASPPELSRLRHLATTRQESALASLVRARARTVRLDGVPGVARYVLGEEHVVRAGATVAHRWTELLADEAAEVYATETSTQTLIDRLRLWRDMQGPIVVHVVPNGLDGLLVERVEMPAPVVAVDLLEGSEPRSHRAGGALWAQVVQQWREAAAPSEARRRGERRE